MVIADKLISSQKGEGKKNEIKKKKGKENLYMQHLSHIYF